MKKQNKLRLNPEELWQRLQDASRNLCKATALLKVIGTCVTMLLNEDAVKYDVINRFSLSINFYELH